MTEPAWTVDGENARLAGWHASFGPGGCDRAGGKVTADVARRTEQGSVLTAWVGGVPKWEGEVSRQPLVHRGQASIEAEGYKAWAQESHGRLFYQSYDVGLFVVADESPFNRANPGKHKLSLQARDGALAVSCRVGEAMANGDAHAFMLAVRESPGKITRYAFDWLQSALQYADIKTFGWDWLNQNLTAILTHPLGGVTSGFIASPVASKDQLEIQVKFNNATTLASSWELVLYNLRCNGIAAAAADPDTFTTSDVVKDVGQRLGADVSGVQPSSVNALPLDFQSGNWLDDVLFYMATLDDWAPPRFLPGPERGIPALEYTPWGSRVWEAYLGRDAEPEVDSVRIANRALVNYTSVGNFPAQPVVITPTDIDQPDPLPGKRPVEIGGPGGITLRDLQPNDTLARQVGMAALRRAIKPTVQGRLRAVRVHGAGDQGTEWDALPGDHIRIPNWGPAESLELPIEHLELAQGQPAAIGILAPATETGLEPRASLESARGPRAAPPLPELEHLF